MSTPDQPETPPLTRRQLREIRNTGATPVLTPDDIARESARAEAERDAETEREAVAQREAESERKAAPDAPVVEALDAGPADETADVAIDQPEAEHAAVAEDSVAEPVEEPSVPVPSAEPEEERIAPGAFADLGVAPLTRRQAREHERIRTASVPIIAPDAAHLPVAAAEPADAVPVAAPLREEAPADGAVDETAPPASDVTGDNVIDEVPGLFRTSADEEATPVAVVNPHFGSGLLAGEAPAVELPPSFDQLISRTGSTGVSSSTPNALILSQTPSAAPLVAPVTATGEVLITGTFDLPEGLGSVGHAPGLHDGKDVDAVLVDGELPAASSPTPIAASAAISQVRNSDEIIRPPAPEKGGGLVVALIITAGVALVAAVGVLVLAFTTGGIF